jgi:carbohydrate-selective porin OprB
LGGFPFGGYMTSRKVTTFLVATVMLLGMTTIAFGQSSKTDSSSVPHSSNIISDLYHQKYLLGDWGGERTKLEEKGVNFDFFYISDMLYAKNGIYKNGGAAWNRVRGTMDIDFGKLSPDLKGLTFHVTGLWQGGPNLGAVYLGSISNPSGLVSARTEILDSYWLAYAMADGKITLRAGQFANMDFYGLCQQCAHYLLEPLDYGFQNRFNDYASFDPASGPGVQLLVNPFSFLYYSVAYTSGNRNPYKDDYNGFHFVKKDSGVLSNAVGIKIDQPGPGKAVKDKYYPGLYEVGSTYNGGKFTDPFKPVPAYLGDTGNYVFYFQGTQAVFRPKAGSNTGMDVLVGISHSPDQTYNFVDRNILAGLTYNGPIPVRPKDSVAFGLSYTHVGDKYRAAFAAANPGASRYSSEKAYEFNYLFQATPYWLIQPTVQVYQDVGGLSKKGTAWAAGFRTKVTF